MQSIEALRKLATFDRERIEKVLYDLLDLRAQDKFDEMMKLS